MNAPLAGKVAFVTGAARGQGRSHALRLADEGVDVIALDICEDVPGIVYSLGTRDELAATTAEIEARGRRVVAIEVDVRDGATMRSAVTEAVLELGRLDIVVANAGVGYGGDPAHLIDPAMWRTVIDINLTGVWNTCSAAIPHLIEGGRGGSMVLTSSAAGLRGMAHLAAYGAAKHGVVGIMRGLAVELGPHGIRVNSLHPTQVDTPMIQHDSMYRLFAPDLDVPTRDDFAARSQTMHLLPVPWVDPADVTESLLYLVSDKARHVTGTTVSIDAGSALSLLPG